MVKRRHKAFVDENLQDALERLTQTAAATSKRLKLIDRYLYFVLPKKEIS